MEKARGIGPLFIEFRRLWLILRASHNWISRLSKKKESTKMSFSLVASHIATWKDEIKVLPQKKRVLFLDKLKMEVSHSFWKQRKYYCIDVMLLSFWSFGLLTFVCGLCCWIFPASLASRPYWYIPQTFGRLNLKAETKCWLRMFPVAKQSSEGGGCFAC